MKTLLALVLLTLFLPMAYSECWNQTCSEDCIDFTPSATAEVTVNLTCDQSEQKCIYCWKTPGNQEVFDTHCYPPTEDPEWACEEDCGASSLCDEFKPGENNGNNCCNTTCMPTNEIRGYFSCDSCNNGSCEQGYCRIDATCYSGIACDTSGWSFSAQEEIKDTCEGDMLVLSGCDETGLTQENIYCENQTECQNSSCGGEKYTCRFNEQTQAFEWLYTTDMYSGVYAEESCNDGYDNDCNGLIDCDDPNCQYDDVCAQPIVTDECDQDSDCELKPCQTATCHPDGHDTGVGMCTYEPACDASHCCNGSCCDQECVNDTCPEPCAAIGEPCGDCCEGICCEGVCALNCEEETECVPGELEYSSLPGVCSSLARECNENGEWGDFPPKTSLTGYESQENSESLCTDGLDNDCDGNTDCLEGHADPSCKNLKLIPSCVGDNVLIKDFCGKIEKRINCTTEKPGFKASCVDGQCTETDQSNNPPQVEITYPDPSKSYAPGEVTGIKVIATDDETIESCYYDLDGERNFTKFGITSIPNGIQVLLPLHGPILGEQEHTIAVKCDDGALESSVTTVTFDVMQKQEPEEPEEGYSLISLILVGLVVFGGLFLIIKYSRRSAVEAAIETGEEILAEKEQETKSMRIQKLKKRKKKLSKEVVKLREKGEMIGLSPQEAIKKESYQEELVRIEDELLENPDFLQELDARADKALTQARVGVPSKQIIQDLVKEGYTEREIETIKKFFENKKQQR